MRIPLSALALLPLTTVLAAHHYVAPGGSNANSGASPAQAWATLQHAADALTAGDSVLVADGTYTGFNLMDAHGDPAHVTVFLALGANALIATPCTYNHLDGINVENSEWVVVRGFHVTGMPRTGIRTALSDHVTIAWNTCADNGVWGILTGFAEHCLIEHNACSGSIDQHGIYFSNSADDPIIRFNECFDNHDNGIHMNGDASEGGDGIISNAQVYGNVIHGNGTGGGSGINCDGVVNSVFYNNLLYDNHASGISLYRIDGGAPSTGDRVYNNTIINAADARWCVNITAGCTQNEVLNNILIDLHPWHGSITCDASALDGFVSDHNLVMNSFTTDDGDNVLTLAQWQALGHDQHSLIAAPLTALFVDPQLPDLHLLGASVQAVDAGSAAVASVVSTDLDGVMRPVGNGFDIGCYEWNGPTAVIRAERPSFSLEQRGGEVRVLNAPAGARLAWHDVLGRSIGQATEAGAVEIPVPMAGLQFASLLDPEGRMLHTWKVWR